MDTSLSIQLSHIATFMIVLPSLLALLRLSSELRIHRLLIFLVGGAALVSILAYVLGSVFAINNLFLLHFYTVFDFIMMTLIFRDYLARAYVEWSIIIFTVAALSNSILIEQLSTFNILARSVEAFVIICYVMRYFWLTLQEMKIQRLEKQPVFWVSCGALLYYAAGFFIFLFSHDLLPFDELWFTYWGIHAIFTILLYLFYSIALWVQPEN